MNDVAPRSDWTPKQRDIVEEIVEALAPVRGVEAVVLGGSYASGFAGPESDIDVGLLYSDRDRLAVDALRAIAERLNDARAPVVTNPGEWGPWVDGGAWLTVRGQRIDWIYRSTERIARVIEEAEAGRFETHFEQMPPFGFFSPTYLGELRVAIPLHDPNARLAALQARVVHYPDALRRAIVDSQLWAVEFGLAAFARKFAARTDVWLTASSLARCGHQLIRALFALNREFPTNDKTALAEVDRFDLAPRDFRARVQTALATLGTDADALGRRVADFEALFREVTALAGDLYRPRRLP